VREGIISRRPRGNFSMRLYLACLGLALCLPLSFGPVQTAPADGVQVVQNKQPERLDGDRNPLPPGAIARLGTQRWRGSPGQLAYAKDGKTLASIGLRSFLYDAGSGKILREFKENWQRDTWAVMFRRDGKLVSLAVEEQQAQTCPLHLRDVAADKVIRTLEGHGDFVFSGAFSADEKTVATGGRKIRLWDVDTGKLLRELPGHEPGTTALAFSRDGQLLASGAGFLLPNLGRPPDPVEIKVWDVKTGRLKARLDGHRGSVTGLAFTSDGKGLLSSGDDGSLRLWDVAEGKQLRLAQRGARRSFSLSLSPDGKVLASWSGWKVARWDVTRWESIDDADHGDGIHVLAFTPGGNVLASGADDSSVRLWDPQGGKQLQRFNGNQAPVRDEDGICSLALSRDGSLVAAASRNGRVTLREVTTGKEVPQFKADKDRHAFIGFVSDGGVLAIGGLQGVRLWDVKSGQLLRKLQVEEELLYCCSLASPPDGRVVAAGFSGGEIYLWDPATGKRLRRLAANGDTTHVFALTFSPDGRFLAAAYGNSHVRLWEIMTGGEVVHVRLPKTHVAVGGPIPIAFSQNLRHIAFDAGEDMRGTKEVWKHPIAIWDVATGKEARRLAGHRDWVGPIAFAPDGKTLASAGHWETTVLLWDISDVTRKAKPVAVHLSSRELETLWTDLAGKDAAQAYRTLKRMAEAPSQAVPFLQGRLRPIPGVGQERLDQLIARLDDPNFTVRETASQELAKLGESAEWALREELKRSPSLEFRRRAERLVTRLEAVKKDLSPGQLQPLRALAVLEEIGDTLARKVLTTLAGGARGVRLTLEAQASLDRLARRPATGP
jgi:WD40 repeat protein